MLKIKRDIIEKIFTRGREYAPLESCGYLAGIDHSVKEIYPMKNIDESSNHFSLDPVEQFKIIKEVRRKGLKVLAVYHTHPGAPARPSKEDIELAFDPGIIYVIASLIQNTNEDIKAFRIVNKEVSPVEISINE